MSDRKNKPAPSPRLRTSHDELAREAREWDDRTRTLDGFTDAPEAVPNASRSTAISIRIPVQLLELLKTFAAREGIGYQVLIKKWLDARLRDELGQLKKKIEDNPLTQVEREPRTARSAAPGFPMTDRADPNGPHYDYAQGDA